jgi:hypothetical protein
MHTICLDRPTWRDLRRILGKVKARRLCGPTRGRDLRPIKRRTWRHATRKAPSGREA